MDKNEVMAMMKAEVGDNLNIKTTANYLVNDQANLSCWKYWDNWYYPQVIANPILFIYRIAQKTKGKKHLRLSRL